MHLARVSFKYLKYYQGLLCAENHVQSMTIGIKATDSAGTVGGTVYYAVQGGSNF